MELFCLLKTHYGYTNEEIHNCNDTKKSVLEVCSLQF